MTIIIAIGTPDGEFVAHYSEKGLARLDFPGTFPKSGNPALEGKPSAQVREWHAVTTKALIKSLRGETPESVPPLDLSPGTEFQQQVWKALRRIASGRTKSYAQVAALIDRPKALRAVGGACGANPIPVLIPCHRVLAANQRLGGFSGGLDWKRKLLAREGFYLPTVPNVRRGWT
jgi:O-6-methylguanine DNA methyltransferase